MERVACQCHLSESRRVSRTRPMIASLLRALWSVMSALAFAAGCSRPAVAPARATLPAGAHLISAASQTAAWCHGAERNDICEDFRTVPVAEVVHFEQAFPAILKARGFA